MQPEAYFVDSSSDSKKSFVNQFGDTRKWYKRHVFMAKFSNYFVWGFMYMALFWMLVVSAVWVMFGMLLEPTKVAPYFAAVTGLVAHVTSLFSAMKGFLSDCKMELKNAIEEFEERILKQVMDEVQALESVLGNTAADAMNAVGNAKKEAFLQLRTGVLNRSLNGQNRPRYLRN
jgi:hypothetical protein